LSLSETFSSSSEANASMVIGVVVAVAVVLILCVSIAAAVIIRRKWRPTSNKAQSKDKSTRRIYDNIPKAYQAKQEQEMEPISEKKVDKYPTATDTREVASTKDSDRIYVLAPKEPLSSTSSQETLNREETEKEVVIRKQTKPADYDNIPKEKAHEPDLNRQII
jgi:hypothetical protein